VARLKNNQGILYRYHWISLFCQIQTRCRIQNIYRWLP